MSLFGKIIKTVVNVAELPIAIAKDVVTLGGVATEQDECYLRQQVEKIKDDADD